ncbi:thiamine-monophosphate kinase [Sporomusaceae bacterium FL31]|nr:thiamine-monophosphate kinase [Sporomusaceae bacterium FL31]GCE35406.1 thiamine-monophosphate kinase [Sporomusaceae bacterium]
MELKQLGEFGLIDLLKENTIVDPASVVVGIGDDAAVLLPTPRQLQLLTTDMLVETVHFDLNTTSPWQLGYKAIAVNLSDIAAMGGSPKHVVISLGIPKELPVDFVLNLYEGMKEICRQFSVNIVGGDTVASPHGVVINVAVTGEVDPTHLQRRSGAKPGDLLVVTGVLGNSAAGLDLLAWGNWEEYEFAWPLVTSHLTPQPQVKAGQIIAGYATSMNDISDGLASEANEIALASQVGIRLFAQHIPVTTALQTAGDFLGKSALDYALFGGEDYQLLFTVEPEQYKILEIAELGQKLTVIGEIIEGPAHVELVQQNGKVQELAARGYNHFG